MFRKPIHNRRTKVNSVNGGCYFTFMAGVIIGTVRFKIKKTVDKSRDLNGS